MVQSRIFKKRNIFVGITLMMFVFSILAIIRYPRLFEKLLIDQKFVDVHNLRIVNHKYAVEGEIEMARSSVTIMGICKNVAEDLESLLESVDSLAAKFMSSRVIFVEGDSSDSTSEILQQWALKSTHNRSVISVTSKNSKEESGPFKGYPLPREGRIAKARNLALKSLLTVKTKYTIVVDMDIIGWNKYGIQDSFGRPSWDVICAHGTTIYGAYRDTYALRLRNINTNHHLGGDDHDLYNISDTEAAENWKTIQVINYFSLMKFSSFLCYAYVFFL